MLYNKNPRINKQMDYVVNNKIPFIILNFPLVLPGIEEIFMSELPGKA